MVRNEAEMHDDPASCPDCGQRLEFSPADGGVHDCPERGRVIWPPNAGPQHDLETAEFALPVWDRPVTGQHRGAKWNGWACPLFTREQGREVMEQLRDQGGVDRAEYDPDRDAFVVRFAELADEPPEVFPTDDDTGLYPIGAGSWCWHVVDRRGA